MIRDQEGNELTNPDLNAGYLVDREEVIHHPAVMAKARKVKTEEVAPNLVKKMVEPAVFPVPAWDETVKWQEYIPYTEEELVAREAQKAADEAARAEAEAAAKAEAEAKEQEAAVIASLPGAVEELAGMAAAALEQIEIISGAIEELAAGQAGEQPEEQIGE